MKFIKMHGIGNDYVYVNGYNETVEEPADLARVIADRHTGVGGDGLILVLPPSEDVDADIRMRLFNSDGSEAQMCGNGIRCVCKLAHDHHINRANPMQIQTDSGVLTLNYTTNGSGRVDEVTVDMGEAVLDLPAVPVDESKLDDQLAGATFVSLGNPHAVFFVDDVWAIDLEKVGPQLECHKAFPSRINVHFVQVHSPGEITMRTWERGSGITLACGTGASAVCVAGVLTDRSDRKIIAHLPGGDLALEWLKADNHVLMTGPATEVFKGEWPS
jgi:diaminopimelate epimerase